MRENEKLRDRAQGPARGHKKVRADNADAIKEIEELKKQLTERGINLENTSASISPRQRKALEEYQRRAEQLDAIRKRFELSAAQAAEAHEARA